MDLDWLKAFVVTFAIGYPLMLGAIKGYVWLSERQWFTDRGWIIGRARKREP